MLREEEYQHMMAKHFVTEKLKKCIDRKKNEKSECRKDSCNSDIDDGDKKDRAEGDGDELESLDETMEHGVEGRGEEKDGGESKNETEEAKVKRILLSPIFKYQILRRTTPLADAHHDKAHPWPVYYRELWPRILPNAPTANQHNRPLCNPNPRHGLDAHRREGEQKRTEEKRREEKRREEKRREEQRRTEKNRGDEKRTDQNRIL